MNIQGGVAIVTGSSSVTGIGAMSARALAAAGCNVVINYVSNPAGAEETAAACAASGVETLICQADVSDDQACRRMIQAALDKWGRIDALVNNAATTKPIKQANLEALSGEEFLRIYAVNVVGAFQMSRAAGQVMKQAGRGAIVNISSVGAWRAGGSSIAYCASKGALNTMTISLARVLAPEVRVNAVCPGGVLGGNWTRNILDEEAYQRRVEDAKNKYPLRRAIAPEDVAATALWLIAAADTMTGECIRMDVGQHLS